MEDGGAEDIDSKVAGWKSTGYTGFDPQAAPYTTEEIEAERQAIPVVREELVVGKREVDTGRVRVYSRETSTPVTESVNLREERATIERRPVDREATEADLRGGTVEVRETSEEAVVGKTSRVVEEVIVGKEASQRTETVRENVRGTEVEVERAGGKTDAAMPGLGSASDAKSPSGASGTSGTSGTSGMSGTSGTSGSASGGTSTTLPSGTSKEPRDL
jgi:uncharacterized protein (TIGR02271 family)